MPLNITWDVQLVGCEYHDRNEAIPEGQAILHLQEAAPHPVHADVRVVDPQLAAEAIALWEPYMQAVQARQEPQLTDGSPNPLHGQPWPEAPRLRLSLAPLP